MSWKERGKIRYSFEILNFEKVEVEKQLEQKLILQQETATFNFIQYNTQAFQAQYCVQYVAEIKTI